MLVEIKKQSDIDDLEHAIRATLGAQRLDVSVLRSKPYIDLRQKLLRHLDGTEAVAMSAYFSGENLVLRVLSTEPLLVWCGCKEAEVSNI